MGKLRPPEGTLKHRWITAGGGFYGQWIWDTVFVVDLLALLPGTERDIREVFLARSGAAARVHSDPSEAMSIEKRYLTSDLSILS